jgi:phage shock protein C
MNNPSRTLYRSRTNRLLGGVCGGLGEYFGIDPTLVRLLFVILLVVGWVVPVVVLYVVMLIIVPEGTPLEHPQSYTPPPASQAPTGVEPKTTDFGGEEIDTGAGGRSGRPAPEPSAQEPGEPGIVDAPTGLSGGEVIHEDPDENSLTPGSA